MSEGWNYTEKRFELHHNMQSKRYAWFCGDKRESDWFETIESAKKWSTRSAYSEQERANLGKQIQQLLKR